MFKQCASRIRVAALVLGAACAVSASSARADVVTDWDTEYLDTVRVVGGPPCPLARAAACMHVAMYDALQAIDRRFTPMIVRDVNPPKDTNRKAAIAAAAHRVLSTLYPARSAVFDGRLASSLATVPAGTARDNGVALGVQVADLVLADHAGDAPFANDTTYVYANIPGAYEPPAPTFTDPPFSPGWGHTKPWCMLTGSQFRAARGPLGYRNVTPLIKSVKYANQLKEVMLYGKRTSTVRTEDQTNIAWFWANDRNGTYKPAGHLLDIAQIISRNNQLTLEQNARLFAMLSVALADAGAVAWDTKYLTDADLWRPVTAIRKANLDNNPLTKANPNWLPLLDFTPPFPAYISGHATFGGAFTGTMNSFFGTDTMTFTATTDEPFHTGPDRTYTNFSTPGKEDGLSRIYLGVHFRMDVEDGYTQGRKMAEGMAGKFFTRTCRADISRDGAVTTADLTLFTNSYFASNDTADYNQDGIININDVTDYMNAFTVGCTGTN